MADVVVVVFLVLTGFLILKAFRQKTKTVDNFVNMKVLPTFLETENWTIQMVYYFKERWEKEETYKRQTTDHVAAKKDTETTVQNDKSINKQRPNKRKKPHNVISDENKETKKQVRYNSLIPIFTLLYNYVCLT